jgi:hypothetical protein
MENGLLGLLGLSLADDDYISFKPGLIYPSLKKYSLPTKVAALSFSVVGIVIFLPFITTLVAISFSRYKFEKAITSQLTGVPGGKLRKWAEFFFSRNVYEQVFEPTLRDLFDEYCDALNSHRPRKARWVRIRGYWSFWTAVVAQTPISIVKKVYQIWKAIP